MADVCHYERRDGHNLVRHRLQDMPDRAAIASSLAERRVFPPPREFVAKARIGRLEAYQALYRDSVADPEAFWAERAEELSWFRKWEKVLEQDFANGEHQWFHGGELNAAYNCLDRHLETGRKKFHGVYTTGDSARVDEDGYVRLMGRIDDVINVSGHRLGTAEIEIEDLLREKIYR